MNKVCFLLLWSVILPCLGQDPTDEIPPGNPTQFPGGDAAWSVAVTPSGPSHGASIAKVDVTRLNGVTRFVITWSSGKVSQRWRFSNVTVDQNPDNGTVLMILDSNLLTSINMVPLDEFDTGAFTWIDRPFYKDTTEYDKTKAYHYEGMVSRMHLNPRPPPPLLAYPPTLHKVWIDKKTLLPLAIDDGFNLAVFTFLPTPTEQLVPPKVIAAEMKRWQSLETPLKPSRPPE